jgi:CBS domain-containing protein
MLHSSIPIGKLFGVDIRVHISFPVLLLLSITWSVLENGHAMRGVGLWVALCFAVLVREIARSIAAAYAGMRLRALFLLPVGGVMAFASRDRNSASGTWDTRAVTASGPLANLLVGLIVLGAAYAFDPHVSLLAPPWIGTAHVLRSFVWTQFLLGAVSLLPSSLLASRRLPRALSRDGGEAAEPTSTVATQAATKPRASSQPLALTSSSFPALNLGTILALVMIVAGITLPNHLWLSIFGVFMLLASQLGTGQPLSTPAAESILVREVMLTEYTLLSTSDTLQDALNRTVHSLQDVFPIVRGDRLVGSVARQTIADRLMAEGDSYLQGIMTRTLQIAGPSEKLVEALRRAASLGASEFIPVVEDGAMLGILTPQSLSRAVQQLTLTRPQPNPRARDYS